MCYKRPYLPSVQYVNPFCAGVKYSQLNYIKVISENGQAPDINHAIIRHGLDLGAQVHLSSESQCQCITYQFHAISYNSSIHFLSNEEAQHKKG